MELSVLGAGTHLRRHCGPTNHRLRLHIPLLVHKIPSGACHMRLNF